MFTTVRHGQVMLLFWALTIGAWVLPAPVAAQAGYETALYSFQPLPDAETPYAGLFLGSDGNFYGTTWAGGAYGSGVGGYGAVFKITPAGTETVLHSFNISDGAAPAGNLIQGADGDFYGTTKSGGSNGYGTVFKITPAGSLTTLYSFASGVDGAYPSAGLILGTDGNYYGTTYQGGGNNKGTVFKITPAGAETVLYAFAGGADGAYPAASLIRGIDGNFYGTTTEGGVHGIGAVFKVTPAGAETVLYSFAGQSDGYYPTAGLIQDIQGNFYGTTQEGGSYGNGTVFKVTATGTETVLHSFGGYPSDGAAPYAGLVQGLNGTFYGTTESGGANNLGTVFKLTATGTETVLHSFAGGADGANPQAGLAQNAYYGFYGTTEGGGANNKGTVYFISAAPSDFNGDGYSDLLLQNPSTGQLSVWFMDGVTPVNGAYITPTQNTAWKVVGDADFNADGKPDILFQNTSTGQLALWMMNGVTATGGLLLNDILPFGWSVVSIADFNGDGSPDLLLQNSSSGQLALWYMSGSNVIRGTYVTPTPAQGWTAVGTGDFNKNGHTDILLQNYATGQLAVWYMSNNTATGGAYVSPSQQTGWRCASVVDVNGDGWPDLIFQNPSSGQVVYWLMNGVKAVDGNSVAAQPLAGWLVVGPH